MAGTHEAGSAGLRRVPDEALPAASDLHPIQLGTGMAQSYAIPRPSSAPAKARWINKGEGVTVAGISLPHGLFYFSEAAGTDYSEPSMIDATRKVRRSPIAISPNPEAWSPGYHELLPDARRRYLEWHAQGRCDPTVDIGHVFLFFYGLERRLFVDAGLDPQVCLEVPTIRHEVQRLMEVYGHDDSFHAHGRRLLEHLKLSEIAPRSYLQEPALPAADGHEIPTSLGVALGQMATDQYPLSASWALAWVLNDPNVIRRPPMERCKEAFMRLFRSEFANRHPTGILLKHDNTRLTVLYRAASSRLDPPATLIDGLPDVTASSGTRKKLQLIVDQCSTVLGPFSRYLGRNPDSAHTLEALLYLPVELWPLETQAELDRLKARAGTDTLCLSYGDLTQRLNAIEALSRDQAIALAQLFDAINVGCEPDVLSGARLPKPGDPVALFACATTDGSMRADSAYQAAAVTLDLASAVAAADGKTSPIETSWLSSHIDAWEHLSIAQRKRLKAHLALQLQQPPELASLKKKLDPLDHDAKSKMANFLAQLAKAEGVVSPQEVQQLERVYKVLSLEPQAVYRDLHATVACAPGVSIVPGHAADAPGFTLDMDRIAQLQRETAEVSALLAGVFSDEAPASPDLPPPLPEADSVNGLDSGLSAFLRLLVSRLQWSRAELETATRHLDLMLDGALEQVNEMAYERFDMPVSEGDDPIEINPDILDELAL